MLPITNPMTEAINMPTNDLLLQSNQPHSPMQPPPLLSQSVQPHSPMQLPPISEQNSDTILTSDNNKHHMVTIKNRYIQTQNIYVITSESSEPQIH